MSISYRSETNRSKGQVDILLGLVPYLGAFADLLRRFQETSRANISLRLRPASTLTWTNPQLHGRFTPDGIKELFLQATVFLRKIQALIDLARGGLQARKYSAAEDIQAQVMVAVEDLQAVLGLEHVAMGREYEMVVEEVQDPGLHCHWQSSMEICLSTVLYTSTTAIQ